MSVQSLTTNLNSNEAYSGEQQSGYNNSASYNRSYYLSESEETMDQIIANLAKFKCLFEQSSNDRFVYNTIISGQTFLSMDTIASKFSMKIEGITQIKAGLNKGKYNIIFAQNRRKRQISEETRKMIEATIRAKTDKYGSITTEQITRHLADVLQSGCFIDKPKNPEEIVKLRGDTFQWDTEKAKAIINSDDDIVLGLYNSGGIVSLAMISSQGESTERATEPDHRGKGYIDALLTAMHAISISKNGETNISAECRYNQSLGVALRAGFAEPIEYRGDIAILTNHVTIGNESTEEIDPVDLGNEKQQGNDRYYRHFVTVGLRSEMYEPRVVADILNLTK